MARKQSGRRTSSGPDERVRGPGRKQQKRREKDDSDVESSEEENEYLKMRTADDEEVDSDEAFDSEDERQFGDIFANRNAAKDEELAGDENEPTLLDMMADSDDEEEDEDEDEEEKPANKSSKTQKEKIALLHKLIDEAEMDDSEDEDDDDDEVEDDDDDEDEDEDDDEDEDEDEDEDDDDVTGETKTSKLMDLIDDMVEDHGKKNKVKRMIAAANKAARKEGEFNVSGKKKLSMADMVKSLGSDRKDLGALKQRIEQVQDANLVVGTKNRHMEARAERKVGYERASEEIGKWVPTIAEHRRAQTVSYPLVEPARIHDSSAQIVDGFSAQSELEREVELALMASGLGDEKRAREDEEKYMLDVKEADPKQIRERQKELAKLKALMFYSEQKARRSNKIKSKVYRRLKKRRDAREEEKEIERLRKIDPEAVQEMEERAALERAKERMSLRHKNTSKFIRGLLKHGGSRKEYTQSVVQEQLDAERNLRRRMRTMNDESDDSEDDDEDGHELRGADDILKRKAGLLAAGIDADINAGENGENAKGLFGLKFMQKGLQREQEEAKKRAGDLMEAIKSGTITADTQDDYDKMEAANNNFQGRRRFNTVVQNKDAKDSAETEGDDEQTKTLGSNVNAHMSSSMDVGEGKKKKTRKLFEAPAFEVPSLPEEKDTAQEKTPVAKEAPASSSKIKAKSNVTEAKTAKAAVQADSDDEGETVANPWLNDDARPQKSQKKRVGAKVAEEAQEVPDVKVNVSKSLLENKEVAKNEDQESAAKRKQQVKLIRRAFAGTNTLSQDFEEEKAEEEDRRDSDRRKANKEETMFDKPGWGSWTGNNVAPKKRRRPQAQPSQLQVAAKKQRAGPKHVLVSEKRNKKVTKYLVTDVPYPFKTREEYEASLRNPLGSDFNTAYIFNKSIKPEVITRAGAIIDPISSRSMKK